MHSSLRKILPLLLLALVAVLLAAACGSGNSAKPVPAGSIAIVGDQAISKSTFDQLMKQAQANYEAQKQPFPSVGTPEYESVKTTIVKGLIQQAEWEQEGAVMGLKVSDQELQKRLVEFKQQYFQGDEAKYKAALEQKGITDQDVRDEISARILSEKIYKAVIGKVKLTDAELKAYYEKNKAQFEQPESREVRHILVKKKALADKIYNQLKRGADFAKLAEQYSIDTGTKANGGKLTAYKGKSVAPFDRFVFAAKTGELSKPVHTTFGWHVIEVLGDIKPPSTTPLADVKPQIRATLLPPKQKAALKKWVADVKEKYKDEISYAPGYAPAQQGAGTTTG
jgi:parvulin-like peptidyl-prolyl isomerase